MLPRAQQSTRVFRCRAPDALQLRDEGALTSACALHAHLRQIFSGPDLRSVKNWSNGQYNSAPPCAMLILEDFDHPMRMVTLSEHREPEGLSLNSITSAAHLCQGFALHHP